MMHGPASQTSAHLETGMRTLDVLGGTPRINAWMFSRFAAHVRGTVLEVGGGIGNLSEHIVSRADRAVLTDVEASYVARLRERFAGARSVEVARYDLAAEPPELVAAHSYDAIVAINVLEHVADDRGAVANLTRLLTPSGKLLVYVPACPWAFGTLDEELGHVRRYTPETLRALLAGAGLEVGPVRYMNLLGLPAWFLNGRILKRHQLSGRQVGWFERLLPIIELEERLSLPIGLGLYTWASKR